MTVKNSNAKLILDRKRKKRLEAGHPWIFQSEVSSIEGDVNPGSVVDIVNHQGLFLARGFANPNSQIIGRVLTYKQDEVIDAEFFTSRVRQAWEYRKRFVKQPESCRVVYGEADFLPGLIVDKYKDVLVVQILSYGIETHKSQLLEALLNVFQPKGIYLRNDVAVRKLEGLSEETGIWYGDVPQHIEIEENGLKFIVDVYEGQKTGYFFDQRENRASIRPLMTGWSERHGRTESKDGAFYDGAEVLECFCHTGSFTTHALHYGAKHVTAVDISELAIDTAKQNVALNGYSDRVSFHVANAFDYLRDAEAEGAKYDVVLLDPPAFAKSKRAVEGACRGYKEINLRGLKLVRDGGYLITASCSYHMGPELFQDVLFDAAYDAHKILRLVEFTGAGKDHPELLGVDEGHYLKFAIYEVHSRA